MNANPSDAFFSPFSYCTCTRWELYLYIGAAAFCSPLNDLAEDRVNVSVHCIANTVCLKEKEKPYSCFKKKRERKKKKKSATVHTDREVCLGTGLHNVTDVWPLPSRHMNPDWIYRCISLCSTDFIKRSHLTEIRRWIASVSIGMVLEPVVWLVSLRALFPCDVRLCALLCNLTRCAVRPVM